MSKIDEVITYGYKFDMGKYFTDGWAFFKKGAGNYIGFTVLYFIIIFTLVFIPFANVISSVIQYTLMVGLFIYTRNLINDRAEFSDFFQGFNSFGQIFLYWLVLVLFILPAIIIFAIYLVPETIVQEILTGSPDPEYISGEVINFLQNRSGSIVFLIVLLILYILFIVVSYSFTLILIADRGMSFWDAMETSRKVISKNFISFFGMYILLTVFMSVVATITCGIGILFALPFFNTVLFAAYNDILGEETEDDEDIIVEVIED